VLTDGFQDTGAAFGRRQLGVMFDLGDFIGTASSFTESRSHTE